MARNKGKFDKDQTKGKRKRDLIKEATKRNKRIRQDLIRKISKRNKEKFDKKERRGVRK